MFIQTRTISKEVDRPIIEDMILQLVRSEELSVKADRVASIRELEDLRTQIGYLIDRMKSQ